MAESASLPRTVDFPRRAVALLATLAVGLLGAFVLAPRVLAASGTGGGFSDERDIRDTFHAAFVEYWMSEQTGFPASMRSVVDYWVRYHVAKAVLATVLLVVLVRLGALLWTTFLRAGRRATAATVGLVSGGVLTTVLALFALLMVMANLQGAIASFASLLPMLTVDTSDPQLADTLDQVGRQLADFGHPGTRTAPAVDVMVDQFARYHAAMAVIAVIVALAFAGAGVASWKRRTRSSDPRSRRVFAVFAGVAVLSALLTIVVVVANIASAADPAPGLLALFEGSW